MVKTIIIFSRKCSWMYQGSISLTVVIIAIQTQSKFCFYFNSNYDKLVVTELIILYDRHAVLSSDMCKGVLRYDWGPVNELGQCEFSLENEVREKKLECHPHYVMIHYHNRYFYFIYLFIYFFVVGVYICVFCIFSTLRRRRSLKSLHMEDQVALSCKHVTGLIKPDDLRICEHHPN